MKEITPRQIAPEEAAVVREALRNAPLGSFPQSLIEEVESLSVVGVCECGCASLYFRAISKEDYRVADGVGRLPSGTPVGVMVWAGSDHVSALDLVDHVGEGKLPIPSSISSWEEYERKA